jgi:alpha-beta hydrolase superfamily lysophospholipase
VLRNPVAVRLLMAACGAMTASCGGTVPVDAPAIITRTERVWIDASRSTPRNGIFPSAPTRTLRTLIWQPPSTDALPVLVMAHGFGGLPEKFDAFASTVAAAGFVVVAPAFPLTNQNAPGGHASGLNDLVNQPRDLSFVITQLLQATSTAGDALEGRIIPANVAVLGHSLGGATLLGLTRKNCCRDARVRASIFVDALTTTNAFGADPPAAAGPPTLILHGTVDPLVAFRTATQFYSLIDPPRFLVGLKGAGHSDAVESQAEPPIPARDAAQRATIAFLNAVFRDGAGDLDATLTVLATEGNVVQADDQT